MIYTIVPLEQVLISADGETQAERSAPALYMGEKALLLRDKEGEYRIERLLSTNPQSYLKAELYPGTKADVKKIDMRDI